MVTAIGQQKRREGGWNLAGVEVCWTSRGCWGPSAGPEAASGKRDAVTGAEASMDEGEFLGILQKVWIKLQGLPNASSVELGAFCVLVLFAATFLFMVVLTCVQCCSCGKPKYQASRVQPLQSLFSSGSLLCLDGSGETPSKGPDLKDGGSGTFPALGGDVCISTQRPRHWNPHETAERHGSSRLIMKQNNGGLCGGFVEEESVHELLWALL
ncbi:unnamed protein product [Menidia menidia]|uniref:(Atlantic silverside) hypothetical protein n=1 Tax=Menidia menidia TaxID=238744 RepID=A0A8S4AW90_9TELE|nr:unnamed protein product [Menidia menidia]